MSEQIAPQFPAATLLVVEDDEQQLRLYRRTLKDFRVIHASNGSAALALLGSARPSVVLLDHILADGERGADFLPRLKQAAPHVPIIVVSGTLDIQGKLKALQGPHSAHYVIEKPVSVRELRKTVEVALTECGIPETIAVLQSLERHELIRSEGSERRFTKRLGRQHELLVRLRSSEGRPNISELAREHEVDRKTIIRDLHDLIDRGQLDPAVYPEWRTAEQGED